jgi:hypothetical protein
MATLKTLSRLIATVTLFAAMSSAETIIVATGVDWNRGSNPWINEKGIDQQAYFAGVILISLTQDGHTYNRDTLCVDLFTDINLGTSYSTTVLAPDDVAGKYLHRVSWLVDNALLPTQAAQAGIVAPNGLRESDWLTTSAQGAGLQLAIWDIVHDAGDGFSSGSLQASHNAAHPTDAGVLFWAQRYETLSSGQSSDLADIYENAALDANHTPAQMLAGPKFADNGPVPDANPRPKYLDGSLNPVPEPAGLALTGSALLALAGLVRFRKRG